jgi:hypothetical protein
MTGLAENALWSQPTLLAVLMLWIIVPLALATTVIARREI